MEHCHNRRRCRTTLKCPSGQYFTKILFASYGLPSPAPKSDTFYCLDGANGKCYEMTLADYDVGTYNWKSPTYTRNLAGFKKYCSSWRANNGKFNGGQGSCVSRFGMCENKQYQTSSKCHSTNSKSKIEQACLNKRECSIHATNRIFGDPCRGIIKHLYVSMTYIYIYIMLTLYKYLYFQHHLTFCFCNIIIIIIHTYTGTSSLLR